jgi:serine/threonine-protein kinase RsbW
MSEHSTEESSARTVYYPARFESLEEVRNFVGQAAQECGLKEASIYAVQMAVDEAFTNIIEHAYGGECDNEIRCTCEIGENHLTITLQDCGHPFNPDSVPEPDVNAPLEERDPGGLGLFFMRQLMDEVSFTFEPGEGNAEGCNILTMVKRKETKV